MGIVTTKRIIVKEKTDWTSVSLRSLRIFMQMKKRKVASQAQEKNLGTILLRNNQMIPIQVQVQIQIPIPIQVLIQIQIQMKDML